MSFLTKTDKKIKEHPELTAFILSFLLLIIYSVIQQIYPFGTATFLRKDLYHQYLPFLCEFRRRLLNGMSLKYSFDFGLGASFYALYVYYLSDPLNFLCVLVPEDLLLEFLTVITYFKIAAASFFMCRYIRYRCRNIKTGTAVLLSLCYGFSGYVAAFDWNVMWMWGIALAPLVLMGFEMMMKQEGCRVFLLAMAFTVWTNYYIAMVEGIFLILYFIVVSIEEIHGIKAFLKAGIRFGFSMAVAGGISAVLLLPEYAAIRNTSFTGKSFPDKIKFYLSFPELILRTLMSVRVETGLGHEPALYASLITLILVPLFLLNKKIPIRSRIARGILLAFFYLSFDLNVLEFIWHGFNYPDSIPARQAFLFVIVCLTSAGSALDGIEEMGVMRLILSAAVPDAVYIICFLLCRSEDHTDASTWMMSGLFIAMYELIFLVFIFKKEEFVKWGYCSFAIVLVFELFFNFNMTSLRDVSRKSYYMHKKPYGVLAEEAQRDNTLNQGLFIRFDTADENIRNISSLAGYHDVSFFASTIESIIPKFYESLGLKSSRVHYMGEGLTPFTSAVLGVDYILANDFRNNQTDFDVAEYADEYDGDYLYKNLFALPFGYTVPEGNYDLGAAEDDSDDPVDLQNEAAYMLGGDTIFHRMKGNDIEESEGEAVIKIPEDGHYYAFTYEEVREVKEYLEDDEEPYGEFEDMKYESIMDLGRLDKGSTVTLKSEEDITFDIALYRFDPDNMRTLCEKLSEESFTLTAFEEDHIEGFTETSEDKKLILTMPSSEGWEILLDGEKHIESEVFLGLFVMIPVPAGLHHISLTYHIPFFHTGLVISFICLLTAALVIMIEKNMTLYNHFLQKV